MYLGSFLHPDSWAKDWPHWHIIEISHSSPFNYIALTYQTFRPTKMPTLEFSFSTEVQTGWRAWKIVDFERRGGVSESRLQALGTSPIWEPYQPNVAMCTTQGTHEAPWPTCRCGFWAFHKRESVEQSLFRDYGGEKGKVLGQVALWGRVLECTMGYRGEYAYPQTLQFVEVDKKTAAAVAELYGVPYSIVKVSTKLKCDGHVVATEYDYDRLYATLQYDCGIEVRVEISRLFEGKRNFDFDNVPPCPQHNH